MYAALLLTVTDRIATMKYRNTSVPISYKFIDGMISQSERYMRYAFLLSSSSYN